MGFTKIRVSSYKRKLVAVLMWLLRVFTSIVTSYFIHNNHNTFFYS